MILTRMNYELIVIFMNSKNEIVKELSDIKQQLDKIGSSSAKETELLSKNSQDDVNKNLLSLVKFVIDENRKTTLVLKSLSDTVTQLVSDINYEEPAKPESMEEFPISGLDAKILQYIQTKEMACAEDIRKEMNYKGKNAASARLNVLFKRGILQRYQMGHTVYYKYNAGKATKTLIVSPPH